ncbi:hypothetical protein KIH27_09735 [Mycobacterium sp. M1]|uniref:PE-PPE domain-containing protein n=1 Tax=Mycolicibacter acidiphilus TaxID=2835306 RepID=A0ABS5RI39_9MYCO|nr:hypothetical protein [Mycolicibacter acidiphilus]MBS9533864.1 hypothetical protein [Mycolicibacter acidiphilus]
MSGLLGVARRNLLVKQGSALAAATVVTGASLLGATVVGEQVAGAPLGHVQHIVTPTAFPTFSESLQNLLNTLHVGTLNGVLAMFGVDPGSTSGADFTADSTVADLLKSFNPGGQTFSQAFAALGVPLSDPLYSTSGESLLGSATWTINGQTVANPLVFHEPASFFTQPQGSVGIQDLSYTDSINGTPLGNVGLGQLVDMLFGGANQADSHSLADLASQLNFSLSQHVPAALTSMLSGVGWLAGLPSNPTYADLVDVAGKNLDNFNQLIQGKGPLGGLTDEFNLHLDENSSINDWLSALLGTPTDPVRLWTVPVVSSVLTNPNTWITTGSPTLSLDGTPATTLGGYLETIGWGTGTEHLADQSLADLLGLNPSETWNDYLANMAFGGSFFNPGPDLGDQTIGTFLGSLLPDSSTLSVTGATTVTSFLEALGLLSP